MKQLTFAFFVAVTFAAYALPAPIPVPTITLLPASGSISGSPGAAVGWGFTLTYIAPSDWVVLTGSTFTGSPVYGNYVDYLSRSNAPFYVAGPTPESTTITEVWNPSLNPALGLGEFDLNPTALGGASIAGNLVVHYSVFSQDPNSPTFDPDTSTVVADATVTDAAQVNVSPEPGSLWMMSAGLLSFAWAAGWRRRNSR